MINKYKHIVYFLFVSSFTFGYGQSLKELQKLQAEFEKLQKTRGKRQISDTAIEPIDPVTGLPRQAQITPYKPIEVIDELEESQYFGYDFFTKRDTVPFWENLPTPPNYLLGPGDELVISLWGETQLRETYTISKDGKIYDEKVGLLNVTGRTIEGARTYLATQFGRVYATLNGKTPTTFMDVSLGELQSINVNFVGQVKYPGVYPIHPFSSVITGLIQSGGVEKTGSLRKIQIKRNGSLEASIDLYQYLINGNVPSNIQLRDQDIVVIPPRSSVITIDSAVVNEGIYEGLPGESVYDLIEYAGGHTYDASSTIGIRRIKPKDEQISGTIYEAHYIDMDNAKLIPAYSGDHISVRHLFYELNQVEIIGQVKVPGPYHYYQGMTLNDLILLSGGFNDSTFWKSVYHDRAEIIRRSPQSRYDKVIPINLNDIYLKEKDIPLQNLDRVIIHANLNYFEKENIIITGEVNIPGAYPLVKDNETLMSIINRAGGYTTKALKNGISIYRNQIYFDTKTEPDEPDEPDELDVPDKTDETNESIRVAWENENITLMPGDSIVVKESTGTVNVSGEVYNPGLIEFKLGKSMRHYINAAGGITESGNNKSIIVIYANGVVSPKKWYGTPKIEDGATIIVNKKPPAEPFDATQFATNWSSILSSLITAIVLSKQL